VFLFFHAINFVQHISLDDLDEKVLREIFMDEGLIKKKDKEREARLLFLGV
jgi:hypothetical protein